MQNTLRFLHHYFFMQFEVRELVVSLFSIYISVSYKIEGQKCMTKIDKVLPHTIRKRNVSVVGREDLYFPGQG